MTNLVDRARVRIHCRVVSMVAVSALALAACGNDSDDQSKSSRPNDEPKAASTTAKDTTDYSAYCEAVAAAEAIKPPEGVVVEAEHAAYAQKLVDVIATAPPSDKKFWEASRRLQENVAGGGSGTVDDAQIMFRNAAPVTGSVKRKCSIDISKPPKGREGASDSGELILEPSE